MGWREENAVARQQTTVWLTPDETETGAKNAESLPVRPSLPL